jgi:hypothetical protein
MALTLDGTNGIVSSGSITTQSATGVIFSDSSNQGAAASPFSLKNRIINGDMVIDQRNNGASVTPTSDDTYTVDRWQCGLSQSSKYSVQQQTSVVPTGYTYATKITSLSSYSLGASDYFTYSQKIEGFNIADLAWGTANAKTVTLSFQVYSSLTGTFGGAIHNGAANRSYPFSYTISSANTWTTISITIPGDTSGTWLTNNGIGMWVRFGLGVGSTYSGTANTWANTLYVSPTGATSVVSTNGATWYVTGVQLERNTTATPFEWLPYSTELALCQRYCYAIRASGSAYTRYGIGECYTTLRLESYIYLPVNMRIVPSLTTTGTASNYAVYSAFVVTPLSAVPVMGGGSSSQVLQVDSTVASGLTAGRAGQLLSDNNTTSFLIFSAEL